MSTFGHYVPKVGVPSGCRSMDSHVSMIKGQARLENREKSTQVPINNLTNAMVPIREPEELHAQKKTLYATGRRNEMSISSQVPQRRLSRITQSSIYLGENTESSLNENKCSYNPGFLMKPPDLLSIGLRDRRSDSDVFRPSKKVYHEANRNLGPDLVPEGSTATIPLMNPFLVHDQSKKPFTRVYSKSDEFN